MIDPITAISAATAAFNGIKQLVATGREIEDCAGQLSKWAGAMSDINFLEQKHKNPPWYKSFMGSPEAEAMKIFAAKEKIEKQKQEILIMIGYMYGDKGQERYRDILREVKAQRQKHAYRKEEIKQAIIEWTVGILAVVSGAAIFGVALYYIGRSQGKWK